MVHGNGTRDDIIKIAPHKIKLYFKTSNSFKRATPQGVTSHFALIMNDRQSIPSRFDFLINMYEFTQIHCSRGLPLLKYQLTEQCNGPDRAPRLSTPQLHTSQEFAMQPTRNMSSADGASISYRQDSTVSQCNM